MVVDLFDRWSNVCRVQMSRYHADTIHVIDEYSVHNRAMECRTVAVVEDWHKLHGAG